jgi:hypothetical protein
MKTIGEAFQEFGSALCDYVDAHPAKESPEWKEGDFEITRIEPGKLWVEDYLDPHREIGPVKISEEVSSLAKVGWYILDSRRSITSRVRSCLIFIP